MGLSHFRQRLRRTAAILVMVGAAGLAGCQQKAAGLSSLDPMSTASTAPASFQATAELGKAWQADKSNLNKGLAYANSLESIGQPEQQLTVLATLHQTHPQNDQLAAIYGKKLLGAGRSGEALPVLEAAVAAKPGDWRNQSALGSAYDQQGLYDRARDSYSKALAIDPNNLSVQNNLGMSFALQGNLKEAERVLRAANAAPRAASEPRLRQNLALVVGLQGRFDEASSIASKDLPQDQVEANMAYLQKMLSQPNTWQQLSENNET